MAGLTLRGAQLAVRLPASTSLVQSKEFSSEVGKTREVNTAAMKRGRGGRSSFSGDVVTVFGANSFIGRGVNNRLGKNGSQMIFPYRGEHYKMMRLKPVGDLGQVLFAPFELKDEDSIRKVVSHSNIVINLIGRGWETKNFSFEDVNVTGPQRIAKICKEAGVQRLVHMSHVNARETPETAFLKGGSRFLATKWEGEMAVKSEFPEATIFRCSDVYGHGDSFINYWMSRWRKAGRAVPLWGKGEMTVKQPVYMSDLVTGIMNSLYDPEAVGQTYEAVGPQRLTQADLIRYMNALTTRTEEEGTFHTSELMFDPITMAKSFVMGQLGRYSLGNGGVFHSSSLDRLERDAISDTLEGHPDLTDLGVKLHTLEQKMPWELKPHDLYAYYTYETVDELPATPTPNLITMEEERRIMGKRSMGPLALLPGIPGVTA